MDFEKEIEIKIDQTREAAIQSAIANYKNAFYRADCKSALLDSQVNTILKLNYLRVKKCNTCNGKKEVLIQKECSFCNGTSISNCSYCKNGDVSCTNCKGIGKVRCSCAYETLGDIILKRYHYNAYCNVCGGSAGGKGQLNCSSCDGSGKTSCSYCEGSGEKKCGYCKKGYITNKECCDDCKGIGNVVE